MASSLYHLKFVNLLSFLSTFHLIATLSFSSVQPLCRGDERSYLLQFKDSFVINKSASSEPWAYPKVASWTLEGNNNDCCSWDGVECDEFTGHVIGLDLNSSCLYGSINSTNSLFHLVHLQMLNLADNHFNYSQIPSAISNLSKLTYLDLSFSAFSSQIPLEVSQLSQLSSLNLGRNSLELKKPSLRSLVENLTCLEKLDLSEMEIISMVPNILANLSSLTSLRLGNCRLLGEFPVGIFKLPNLRVLEVWGNEGLIGHLPDFQWSSNLERMDLSNTSFSGMLPSSIGNLGSLTTIFIWGCNFSGFIPSSLGNLTRLNSLDLSLNTFEGHIPSSFVNLGQLSFLYLTGNEFTGPIPFELANLTKLIALNLGGNNFADQIPSSIFNLTNLEFLDLSYNYFSGTVEFDKFVKLKKLTMLYLSYNQVSFLESETCANRTLQKFVNLGLAQCNLSKFPNFLAKQDELELLELQDNNIHGQVPEWVWNMSKESLKAIRLSHNFLTSLGQHPILLPWTDLAILDISSNNIQGSLPIPSSSTLQYHASNNSFIGKISELICNLSSLQVLDLSENNLSGPLPQCLHRFGDSLVVLDIRRNKLEGSIPQTWANGSKLMIIDFSQNKFQGWLPRSLAKCKTLKALDLSNNQFNDTFPSWLGSLPDLKILILRSNKFYGPIKIHNVNYEFPNLQIVDLSYNSFTGMLPVELLLNSNASRSDLAYHLSYIQVNSSLVVEYNYQNYEFQFKYSFSMMMTNKGVNTIYEKVQEIFTALDFSSNRFAGAIPESIGNIKVLHLLNLSNNILTDHIPLTLGNLVKLESLDLSQNKLVGEIPQQLTQLTFLESFNVSHNDLVGLVPQGKQFNTFQNSSFEGNSKLCGNPLSKKCKYYESLPPLSSTSEKSQASRSPLQFGWRIVMIGYGCGLLVGVTIGHVVIARNHVWLMKTFGVR
ncbi:hypothetical protein RGQ29_030516 [Quercus rubra]|uniref:Leucine-rich repeat-containing N-terminal plant-type domain-containing protein n=1 Tax=Quercus rubra TaxID=3512 RepID=A0AAN7EI67_QUERU|nr:hypothetical protein RGQ29_030516 [Quercus rubra]